MNVTTPRILTAAATPVIGAGLAAGGIEWDPLLLGVSIAGVLAVAVGWVVSRYDAHSPVGPAVAWSVAAIVAVGLHDLLGALPWSVGLWPFNLVGILGLLLVFPDGPQRGRLWAALPWSFAVSAAGLQIALWGATSDGGRVTGTEPAPWRLGIGTAAMALLGATMILAVASVVVRHRRGTVRTRQQIRWLMLAGIVVVVLLVGGWIAEALGAGLLPAYAPFLGAISITVPAAVGVAIVRYDLFDVDRLLSTAVAWLVTVAMSAGVFALVVFLVGEAVAVGGGPRNSVAAFVTALVFLPLQRFLAERVGRLVDHDRFVALANVDRFAADVRRGRRAPEEVEEVLREVQNDPGLVVQVRTPSGRWARLDGTPVSQPSGLALEADGEAVAMIHLGWDSRRARRRLADVAKAAWVPIEVSRLQLGLREALEQAKDSRTRLAVVAAEERRRLERDLHDRAQQRIVASAMSLRLLQARLPEAESNELESTVRELKATVDELRQIAHGVRPSQLDDGLEPALAQILETCPLPVDLDIDEPAGLDNARRLTAYLVVNEAIVNALKHACAARIRVRIRPHAGRLSVMVSDDGVGGVPADAPLTALRDRVLSVGGTLMCSSPVGSGTTVEAVL